MQRKNQVIMPLIAALTALFSPLGGCPRAGQGPGKHPLVVMEETKQQMVRTRAPIHQFFYSESLAGPDFKEIVAPNSNTLYVSAWLDLASGPVILRVPENKAAGTIRFKCLTPIRIRFETSPVDRQGASRVSTRSSARPGRGRQRKKKSRLRPTPFG